MIQIADIAAEDVWSGGALAKEGQQQEDRSLWTARLFCRGCMGGSGGDGEICVQVQSSGDSVDHNHYNTMNAGTSAAAVGTGRCRTSKLTLTWLQDLTQLSAVVDRGEEISPEYRAAIADWRRADRLSLADILAQGDAVRMLRWRLLMQTAYDTGYGARDGRIVGDLGVEEVDSHIFSVFHLMLTFEDQCFTATAAATPTDAKGCPTDPSALLLGMWMAQLVLQTNSAASESILTAVLSDVLSSPGGGSGCCCGEHSVLPQETLRGIVGAFTRFWCTVEALGNPSLPHLIGAYLKKLILSQSQTEIVLAILFQSAAHCAPNMHTRAVFLAAWLIKDRRHHIDPTNNATEIEAVHNAFSNGALRITGGLAGAATNDVDEQYLHHRRCGVDILAAVERLVFAVLGNFSGTSSPGSTSSSSGGSSSNVIDFSSFLEDIAQRFVALHIQLSLDHHIPTAGTTTAGTATQEAQQLQQQWRPRWGVAVLTKAPVRIDLAGGWSDTPPICYEQRGAVSK